MQVAPGTWLQQRLGNTYTACLYMGLAALMERCDQVRVC